MMRIATRIVAASLCCAIAVTALAAGAAESAAENPAGPAASGTAVAPAEQTAPAAPAAPATPGAPVAPATVTLHANALVPLRLLQSLSSDSTAAGTHFKLEVTDDINVDDTLVIPAGSIAEGEVIHAAKSGMLGKAGELSISARFVHVGERAIRLHAALGTAGANKSNVALFIPFVRGGKVEIAEGTELIAKVANDEVFPATVRPGAADDVARPGSTSTTSEPTTSAH